MNLDPLESPLVALTIAGSDSGGGAGVQADLKTFATLRSYGVSALTAITAQNPEGVRAIQQVSPAVIRAQIEAVFAYFAPGCVKVGMLPNAEAVLAVAEALRERPPPPDSTTTRGALTPLVVDPVMVATSGARLLPEEAIDALCRYLLPLATVITPNLDEATVLGEVSVASVADLEPAARRIFDRVGVPVLLKGGHLTQHAEALDLLWDGRETTFFGSPFVEAVNTHGSGCTLSAAVAVYLGRGYPLADAVEQAKAYLLRGLRGAIPLGQGLFINHGYDSSSAAETPARKRSLGSAG